VNDEFKTKQIEELLNDLSKKIKEVNKAVNKNEKRLVPKDHKEFLDELVIRKWERHEYRLKRLEDNCIEPDDITSYYSEDHERSKKEESVEVESKESDKPILSINKAPIL